MGSSFGRHPFCSIRVNLSMSLYVGGLTLECQGELVTLKQEFPIKSSLSPAEYGDPASAILEKHIAGHLEGLSIEQVTSGLRSCCNLEFCRADQL
jgi:hypothetical protein